MGALHPLTIFTGPSVFLFLFSPDVMCFILCPDFSGEKSGHNNELLRYNGVFAFLQAHSSMYSCFSCITVTDLVFLLDTATSNQYIQTSKIRNNYPIYHHRTYM